MNTEEELEEAFKELKAGTFTKPKRLSDTKKREA
jgi:hypothetical protein